MNFRNLLLSLSGFAVIGFAMPGTAAPLSSSTLPLVTPAESFRPGASTSCVKRFKQYRAGHYDDPVRLKRLQKTRDFYQIDKRDESRPVAYAWIENNGKVDGSYWNEGAGVECGHLHKGQLWLRADATGKTAWYGPFVYTAKDLGVDGVYFHYLFGNACYQAGNGESWCFDKKGITIGGRHREARLDTLLPYAPSGGNPVLVDGEPDNVYWMFVPAGAGWKVYRYLNVEEAKEFDPKKVKPWKVLRP
ncbi:hypothetical protein [Brachymonas denitrificans]|uniref:hypothetical protein n=1 Tax=Brachymonas denitrificans TaxID=28220 RepID=UPI002AFF8AFF|nr:hypothetical protein [Brachymonas denitrificans]